MKFLRTIAKDEGVAETTLDRYYKKYGNIDKAVYMAKIQRSRNQKVTIRNTELSLSDLSIVLGIKESELLNMLNSGMKIEDIKKSKTKKTRKSPMSNKKLLLPNGHSLLEYCIENGLNFSCIYYSINTYGKTIEEAIKHYKEKGQERKVEISDIAKKWYYLSGDERKDILDINNVTNYEQSVIEELSQNITKYKNIINAKNNKKMEGVSFNGE